MFHKLTAWIQRSALYFLLGLGVSLFVLATSVHASGTVVLQHFDRKISIALADIEALAAEQPISPELQQFLQITQEDPAEVRQWLTLQITQPEVTQQISSDFVLLQINKVVGDPLGRESLEPLRVAFKKTFKTDNAFSILDILKNYPESDVRLELSRLEQVYTDVNQLVTRIQPVLQVTEALLPELLCNCNVAAEPSGSEVPQSIAYSQAKADLKSLWPGAATRELAKSGGEDDLRVALAASNSPALANKRLVIDFGPFGRSIGMQDLTRFAETGEISRGWRFFFNVAGVNSEDVRRALKQEVSVNLRFLDQTLNSLLGEFALYQMGQVLHTPSKTANIQALRSAAVLSVVEDDRLSFLEMLQRYPTQQVHLDGARLARLGRNVSRFQARGGVRSAVTTLEDWLIQLQASAAESVCTCDKPTETGETARAFPDVPTISPDQIAQFLPPNWQPVAAHREDRGIIKVIWQQGSPYDMGYQHGQYLHDEIASLGPDVLGLLRFAGRGLALGRLAARRSYPEVVEECRGLTAATQDIGMTLDACLVLAYGDVYQEIFANTLPNILFWEGCSQWVGSGDATKDGRIYHGSTLDNDKKPIDFIVNHPVIFVRQPDDGLPHVFITYPGMVWPNWGLNVAGITLGLDSLHPRSVKELPFEGRSEVQIMGQILKTSTSFAEIRQVMETQPSGRANLIMATDGKSKEAGVFEVIGKTVGVRPLQKNGVLYTTNHAVLKDVFDRQELPLSESSVTRFERFAQLMEPNGSSSLYGQLDPANMAKIGRDRTNPHTGEPSPLTLFDDDASPGGNGSLRQGLYDPDKLLLWVAAGRPPVPENPFVCFSLGEMLNFPNATPCAAPSL